MARRRSPYLTGLQAGCRLMQLALEKVFGAQDGVSWSISINYQGPDGKYLGSVSYGSGPADETTEQDAKGSSR